jgi:hypothetical protein
MIHEGNKKSKYEWKSYNTLKFSENRVHLPAEPAGTCLAAAVIYFFIKQ